MTPVFVQLLTFTTASIVFTLTPGMDTALALRLAAAGGKAEGWGGVLGICAGLFVWGLAAAVGLTALLAASHAAYQLLAYAGAAYLAYLGLLLLLRPARRLPETEAPDRSGSSAFVAGFRKGLATDLLNPQVGIFILTFFPQFMPPGVGYAGKFGFFMLLSFINILLCVIWLGVLVEMAAPFRQFFEKPGIVVWFDRLTGLVFLYFGIRLIFPG